MPEYHCNYSSNSFWHALVLWGQNMFSCDEAMLLRARSYVIVSKKLYYCGLEAILLWGRSYVSNVVTL